LTSRNLLTRGLLVLLGLSFVQPDSVSASSFGGQAAALQRYGPGASGFAGAAVSLAHDPVSFLLNPAGAAYIGSGSISGTTTMLPMDRTLNVLGFGRRLPPRAGFGVTWVNSGVEGVVGYDTDGNPTGSLTNAENALAFTFATRFSIVALGVSAKWYHYALDDQTSAGWAVNLGMMAELASGFRVGAAARDIGGKLRWTTDGQQGQIIVDDAFPLVLAAGASYMLAPAGVTIAADYERIENEGSYANIGLSWRLNRQFRLRTGYRRLGLSSAPSHEGSPTAGIEFATRFSGGLLQLRYAARSDPFGLVHSLGFRFGVS
jgi:hypothetical protein